MLLMVVLPYCKVLQAAQECLDQLGEGETYMTQYPWPEVEINTYDEDGNINGTVLQGVGRII
jgi:hypothetical protein